MRSSHITRVLFSCILIVIALPRSDALAGQLLLSQLPSDGIWAEYKFQTITSTNGMEVVQGETQIRVSSVGEVEESGESCRWIEVQITNIAQPSANVVLKLLVQEKFFKAGKELERHIVRAWTEAPGMPARSVAPTSHEVKNVCSLLFGPLENGAELAAQELNIPDDGKHLCEGKSGTAEVQVGENERLTLHVKVWHHAKSPFGGVRLESEIDTDANGMQFTVHMELLLTKVGEGATSALPNSK